MWLWKQRECTAVRCLQRHHPSAQSIRSPLCRLYVSTEKYADTWLPKTLKSMQQVLNNKFGHHRKLFRTQGFEPQTTQKSFQKQFSKSSVHFLSNFSSSKGRASYLGAEVSLQRGRLHVPQLHFGEKLPLGQNRVVHQRYSGRNQKYQFSSSS